MKRNFIYDSGAHEGAGGVLVKTINDNFEKTSKQIAEIEAKHKKELDEAKAAHQKSLDDLTKANDQEIQKAKAAAKEASDKVEALEKKMATDFAPGKQQSKSFVADFEEAVNKPEHVAAIKSKTPNYAVELGVKAFGTKAVGDMAAANLTGSYFVSPDVRPGVVLRPYNQLHLRDLLPIGRTTSNIIRHIRDNGGEGGPAMVAAGGTKPQMDRDLSIEDASVRKIATYLRVPEEMVEDIPYLVSFITNIGTEEVMAVEDAQIIYGDGTGQNLSGLFTNKTAFAAGAVVLGASSNRFDVLRAARMQMRKLKRTPSFALVSPTDYFIMTSAKDTTNNYILQGGGNGLIPALDGVPVIEMNQMTDGDFLLVDRLAAEIDFRSNVNVRFYDQDRDNAITNMVTIVIEERLALPIYYTAGLVGGTFTAAITDLTS